MYEQTCFLCGKPVMVYRKVLYDEVVICYKCKKPADNADANSDKVKGYESKEKHSAK